MLETCSGLVTGAVAERLGGFGHVCSTHIGSKCHPLDATRMFNFTESVKSTMSTAPLATLCEYQRQATNASSSSEVAAASGGPAHLQQNGVSHQAPEQAIAELNSDCMRDVQNELSEPPQQAVVEQLIAGAETMTGMVLLLSNWVGSCSSFLSLTITLDAKLCHSNPGRQLSL